MSESKRRKFTAKQKLEIVLAGLREDRSVRDVCREHQIQEALYYQWREQLLEAGAERFVGKEERAGEKAKEKRIAELERVLGRKTLELEIAGKALRGWE
ncbi:MAG: transposase [Solirubrobacterales bacterium]